MEWEESTPSWCEFFSDEIGPWSLLVNMVKLFTFLERVPILEFMVAIFEVISMISCLVWAWDLSR
jgi:hypothetical protein